MNLKELIGVLTKIAEEYDPNGEMEVRFVDVEIPGDDWAINEVKIESYFPYGADKIQYVVLDN